MANKLTVKIAGINELKRAVKRNPRTTKQELAKFFVRAKAEYNKTIIRNPWQVGGSGGGVPVDTQTLRDSHQSGTKIRPFQLTFGPDERVAPYAKYVHGRREGEINSRTGVKSRPWLNYAFDKKERKIRDLADKMLLQIIKDLAK